ncbi:MAG: hypothetical protein ACYCS1_08420 [Gammaproteobacteria bacterium]
MSPRRGALNTVRDFAQRRVEPNAVKLCFVDAIYKEPRRLIRLPPLVEALPLIRAQSAIQPVARDVLNRRVKGDFSGDRLPVGLHLEFFGLSAAGLCENDNAFLLQQFSPGEPATL